MTNTSIYIEAVGLCGPELENWNSSQAKLRGETLFNISPTVIPAPNLLPPAERRRVGTAVKLALAVATDALSNSPYKASNLLSVFSSSGGDGDNCHVICEALASPDRLISPTRFTNSVHNAPSGYWGIAAHAQPASTSLCAFDASFSAGFLEASTQVLTAQAPVLFVAYDTPYPEPLHSKRPIAYSFGVAFVLSHTASENTLAKVSFKMGKNALTHMSHASLESLRLGVPAARSLPLLHAIASKIASVGLSLDLFDNQQLLLDVQVINR